MFSKHVDTLKFYNIQIHCAQRNLNTNDYFYCESTVVVLREFFLASFLYNEV